MAEWFEGLTEKQRRFCEAFSANGGNALDAARIAGYKKPHPEGARLLQKATICSALEKLRESTTKSSIATREERQEFWTKTMKSDDLSMSDRLRASELLGKSQTDFVERKELTGKDGAPLIAEVRVVFVGGGS